MGLVRELKQETKLFIREEIQLAKSEMAEKLAGYGGDTARVAVGGFLGYAGLIVFLGALGALLAFGFNRLGLDPLLAGSVGLGIIGLAVIAVSVVLLMNGIKAIKKQSLTPARTIGALHHLKGAAPEPVKIKDERTIDQVEASVVETEARMAETLDELAERVSLSHLRQRATTEVRSHPYRWGLIAASCGAAGSYMLKRKLSK